MKQEPWVQSSLLLFSGCVNLTKSFYLTGPQFLHLKNESVGNVVEKFYLKKIPSHSTPTKRNSKKLIRATLSTLKLGNALTSYCKL